jgi:hypothetical protein
VLVNIKNDSSDPIENAAGAKTRKRTINVAYKTTNEQTQLLAYADDFDIVGWSL